ncbi:putative bifunctional diguanylate cyclase/phosphodiesterase [Blastococcus capsensis]|uniref:putative bifunctional diguanylate cyclase/phosphodiesterase n=1 Tax=Blastococcus capsensis TaxID=1564163 RepID=UPI002540A9E8|nr:EAL domain-containing protein [Blastococcus capsensis]MDK3255085.1 EAL domain-containing protein [Blastococcus capsensis]
MPDAVYRLDQHGRFAYLNASAERLLGHSADELLGRDARDAFPGLRGSLAEDQYHQVLEDGRPREFQFLYEPKGRWYEVRIFPDPAGAAVLFRDVDLRHRRDLERDAQVRQLTAVLEALPSPTVLVGRDGRILSTNGAWIRIGETLPDVVLPGRAGEDYLMVMSRGLEPQVHAGLAAGLRALLDGEEPSDDGTFRWNYSCANRQGIGWFHLQATRVDDEGRVVITHTDITDQVRAQEQLLWRAQHDDLTGLPNRSRLLELTGEALAADHRAGVALLVLDLDGFKTVNDSLGHQIGDELLRLVGGRISEQIRPGDAVARLGADQFVVLAHGCDASEAAALAFRLQSAFGRPFAVGEISVPVSASIGVAVARPEVRDAHHLLSDADAAMFAAKSSGRDRVHLFSPALREAARWRLEVATRLRGDAIDQLVVHYQPVVRLDTGHVEGVEALVRWQHPERGLLSPDTFLSVAEETGQIIPITRWLLRETTLKAAQWAAQGLNLRMSVNVSARHFSTETLVRDVRVALQHSGLPADQLILELTETSVAEDPTRAEDQLSLLRGFGVRVAIDDFGTGWSSLAQLFALPIGTLKIDRSLLAAAERVAAGETGAVLTAIVGLTRTLGIRSVAEGIETVEHLRMVQAAGCDMAQGWLLGHPMPAERLPEWVREVRQAGGDVCALAAGGRAVPAAR